MQANFWCQLTGTYRLTQNIVSLEILKKTFEERNQKLVVTVLVIMSDHMDRFKDVNEAMADVK